MSHTVLVKRDGEKRASRVDYGNMLAIIHGAISHTTVRHTVHRNKRETVVTDYYLEDGERIRVTEVCAI
jgi:hypothetical protein